MITYQDYLRFVTGADGEIIQDKVADFVQYAITDHKGSDDYKIAKEADLYDRQKNVTINDYVKNIYTLSGEPVEDFTATNNKIASNFFHRLNSQRCTYSLGNGISFANDKGGKLKASLGKDFDNRLFDAGYFALLHKVSFTFWDSTKAIVFPFTEFVPLWDEEDASLKAGIRYWQIDNSKPLNAIFFEVEGYTKFKTIKVRKEGVEEQYDNRLVLSQERKPYKKTVWKNEVGDEVEIFDSNQYTELPIVPFWGTKRKQSTLVGMKQLIDSFDLILSGFANDLTDCAEIYWILENYGGMTDEELVRFRDRMKINHIVEIPTGNGGAVKPYTQDVPYNARKEYLTEIRNSIYENFGALDVHAVSADSTNDHLEAAYQPMDEEADDFEYQCIQFILNLLKIAGFEEDIPIFKRNRVSNNKEQVEMVMQEAEYLDEETVLNKLPNITPDEVEEILARKKKEDQERMLRNPFNQQADEQEVEEEEEEEEAE